MFYSIKIFPMFVSILQNTAGLKCPKCIGMDVANVPASLRSYLDNVLKPFQNIPCNQELTGQTKEIKEETCQGQDGKDARCMWINAELSASLKDMEGTLPINVRDCYETEAVPGNGCRDVSNLNEIKTYVDPLNEKIKSLDAKLKGAQGKICLSNETYGVHMSSPLNADIDLKCPKCIYVDTANVPETWIKYLEGVLRPIQNIKCRQEKTGTTKEIEEETCQAPDGEETRCMSFNGELKVSAKGKEGSLPIHAEGCYYDETAAMPANGCHDLSKLDMQRLAYYDVIKQLMISSNASLKSPQGKVCLANAHKSSAPSYAYKLPLNLIIGNFSVMCLLKYV